MHQVRETDSWMRNGMLSVIIVALFTCFIHTKSQFNRLFSLLMSTSSSVCDRIKVLVSHNGELVPPAVIQYQRKGELMFSKLVTREISGCPDWEHTQIPSYNHSVKLGDTITVAINDLDSAFVTRLVRREIIVTAPKNPKSKTYYIHDAAKHVTIRIKALKRTGLWMENLDIKWEKVPELTRHMAKDLIEADIKSNTQRLDRAVRDMNNSVTWAQTDVNNLKRKRVELDQSIAIGEQKLSEIREKGQKEVDEATEALEAAKRKRTE